MEIKDSQGFKILSHAGLCVYDGDVSVVVDPWLIGSCYWKSWYNYPPLPPGLVDHLHQANAIYITHVHWDHWHGVTLKKLDRNKLIITHDEPHDRSVRDLKSIGFKNILLLKHGESVLVEDKIKLTAYQFGLFLNDSAVVLETKDMKILDANDAKIAGLPLRNLVKKHGQFDFALRSHSSANDRVCYEVEGSNLVMDDNDHYARSWKYFMDAVKPKYGVPFASNHCHLHPEVIGLNKIINNPYLLEEKVNAMGGLKSETQFQVMLPGDSWDTSSQFQIVDKKEYFTNIDSSIASYLKQEKSSIDKYLKLEAKVKSYDRIFKKYAAMVQPISVIHKRNFKSLKIDYAVTNAGNIDAIYEFIPYSGQFKKVEKATNPVKITIPAIVLRDSVYLNMFHHAGISKRLRYNCKTEKDFLMLQNYNKLLENIELGFLPISNKYLVRLSKTYVRRWRELLTYFSAFFFLKVKKMPIYLVEEEILKRT